MSDLPHPTPPSLPMQLASLDIHGLVGMERLLAIDHAAIVTALSVIRARCRHEFAFAGTPGLHTCRKCLLEKKA